jgi:hypothetical protein
VGSTTGLDVLGKRKYLLSLGTELQFLENLGLFGM